MRLKRVRSADGGVSVAVERDGRWVALAPLTDEPWGRDLVALLAGGAAVRAEIGALVAGAEQAPLADDERLLPFEPRSLRAFSIYPAHVEQSARVLVKRLIPLGSGLELDRWIRPGGVVELELEGIGTLTNPIGGR